MTRQLTALIDQAIDQLHTEQRRVAAVVEHLPLQLWDRPPSLDLMDRLVAEGHFTEYEAEARWNVRSVVGHLTDSATIFADRIHRIRTTERPWLADFVTDEPERIGRYRTTHHRQARTGLASAQAGLVAALGQVSTTELGRPAVHETDGDLTLGDVVAFLPEHQRDHAVQLELLSQLRA